MTSSPTITAPPPRVPLGSGVAALPTDLSRVVFTLELKDSEPDRLLRCVHDLLLLLESPAHIEQLAGGVFFAFNGLERDPRQVHNIPECRTVLRGLHARWPYWMHFLAPEPDLWSVLILSLLPPGQGVRLPNGRIGLELDQQALIALVQELTVALRELHTHLKVAPATHKRMLKHATRAIERATGTRLRSDP